MYPQSTGFQSDVYQNSPNLSLMFTMYSSTFGNGDFVIQAPSPGEVGQGFPNVPYLSLEALIYQQQSSNPQSAPLSTIAGSSGGQQVIASSQTANDSTGTSRFLMGTQNTT